MSTATTTFDWENFLGPNLNSKDGSTVSLVPTQTQLSGKIVLLYFSAHWCPPCRQFTPKLCTFYNTMKASGKNVEIVFLSSDKNEEQFNEYYSSMPFCSLPFNPAKKNEISGQFGVKGIPTLAILDVDGSLITDKGVQKVMGDLDGVSFPWYPKTFFEEVGTEFKNKNNEIIPASSFENKYIGVYFSAHWCPPCRQFTPKLAKFYKQRKETNNDFEIIFVSADRDEGQFNEYLSEMPWIAIPLKNKATIRALNSRFESEGIPHFVILDQNGNVITDNGVEEIMNDSQGKRFPYFPDPIQDLKKSAHSYGKSVNDKPSLILFLENADDSEQDEIRESLTPIAEEFAKSKANTPQGPKMLFFATYGPNQVGDRIRDLVGLPKGRDGAKFGNQMVILDINNNGAFYRFNPDSEKTEWAKNVTIDENSTRNFIDSFFAGSLTRLQLGK